MSKKILLVASALLLIARSCVAAERVEVNGMKASCSGMNLKIGDGELKVAGKKITFKGKQLAIEPVTIGTVENEAVAIGDEKPQSWAKGTRLSQAKTARLYHGLPGCMVPNSVVIKSADGSAVYEENTDYLVDHGWGAIGRIPEGRIQKGEKVSVSYKYSFQRLDLLQCSVDGMLSIKKGKEEKTCPLLPDPDEGNYPLANIFLPYHTAELDENLIFSIGPPLPEPTKSEVARNARFVKKTLDKLRKSDTITIVCWGNSVTSGGDASTPSKAYPKVFVKMLQEKFPDATIKMKNAGIGGSNTNQRLPSIEKEVLKYNPDLVTIEYVNDMGMSEDNLRNNYFSAIDQIREKGGEVIIITPHFTMPSMMGISSIKEAVETRPAVQFLRDIAKEKEVGLADASKRWEHLAKEGLPYTTLLYNGINHPDDRGHSIFAEELMKFFPEK